MTSLWHSVSGSRGLPTLNLHKLLYYCQGHHLAAFGVPLFRETISAWDQGPVVGEFWHRESQGEASASTVQLTEGQLNTVGYGISRLGGQSCLGLDAVQAYVDGPRQASPGA